MKNRTVIGIICVLLAAVSVFVVTPLIASAGERKVSVPAAKNYIPKGSEIKSSDITALELPAGSVPSGIITDPRYVAGLTAVSDIYAGDCFRNERLASSGESKDPEDMLESLSEGRVAVSFTIDSFAAGLSGKLLGGDIISLIVSQSGGEAVMPPQLRYLRVVTTTTSGGVDREKVTAREDGSIPSPATVTLLVSPEQARLIAGSEERKISCALVYRGDEEVCQIFLSAQEEYLAVRGSSELPDDGSDPYEYILDEAVKKATEYKIVEEGEKENG